MKGKKLMGRLKMPVLLARFWLSYTILIAILLLIIGVPLYVGGYSLLSKEAYETAENDLTVFSQTINTRLREMDRISVQLSANEKLIPYFLNQGGYYINDAIAELDKIRRSNDFIYDVVVYYTPEAMKNSGQGFMVAASGVYDPNVFFDVYYRYETWNLAVFRQDVKMTTRPAMRPMEGVWQTYAYTGRFMTYISPLLFNLSRNERGVVLFLIHEDQINAIIDNSSLHQYGMTRIIDSTGRELFSVNRLSAEVNELQPLFSQDFADLQPGAKDITQAYDTYKQITIKSGYNHWLYVGILPRSVLLQKVYANLKLLIYILVCALVLGFIIAWLLSVSNYKPIKLLRTKLAGSAENSDRCDDLMMISSTVDTLSRSNQSLIMKLKSQQDLARIQTLQQLLNSRFSSEEEVRNALKACDAVFPHETYAVMVFSIDDYQHFMSENEKAMQDLLRFAMLNVIEELSDKKGCKGYGIDAMDARLIAVVISYDEQFHQDVLFEEIGCQFIAFFQQNFKCPFTAGVSQSCRSLVKISHAYEQAVNAVSRQFIQGKGRVIFWSEQDVPRLTQYWYPVDEENLLLSAIRQGNGVDAEKTVQLMVGKLLSRQLPVQTVKFILSTLVHRIIVVLNDMRIDADGVQAFNQAEQDTIREWQQQLVELLWQACRKVRSIKESHNFELKDQLLSYIQEHYNDNNLSLQLFADRFGLSAGYITRFFKNQTGIPLMNYLDQVRLQQARQLLEETNLPVYEIVMRCGYLDETNFIRKFKRQHGLTPMQYRRSYHLDQTRSGQSDA